MLTGSKRTNRKLHEQSLIQTTTAPRIQHNEGWQFVMYEPASRTPFKPGIVASEAGAQLRFEVDTSQAREPSVTLQYLESRLGMGTVRLECRGCICDTVDIDATGDVARLSTLVTRATSVTAHKHCELQLTVLNHTSDRSGRGHKFKLARLFVTGAVTAGSGQAHGVAPSNLAHAAPCRGAALPAVPSDAPCAGQRHGGGLRGRWRDWRRDVRSGGLRQEMGAAREEALATLMAARQARTSQSGTDGLKLLLSDGGRS